MNLRKLPIIFVADQVSGSMFNADAHVIESLRYQMAIDGSRAWWRPK